ncbi:MAG: protein-L-isoaspartate(D-aspartate) O-methyltransferase [Deltaproteobacteria bacterium]|nr:protein-L-isoaspartate(D-aspartate) O-methyltransferase [Deltaproteobacteria bacterium]
MTLLLLVMSLALRGPLAGASPMQKPCHGFCQDAQWAAARNKMVDGQIRDRGIRDAKVLDTMRAVERHLFIDSDFVPHAYEDRPLPIGFGQTISQPYIVAFMTEAARPNGNKVALEIGTGSGYQAAVLSKLVKHVHTIEIVEPLYSKAKQRLARLGYKNVTVHQGDGFYGLKKFAPFDIILVTAAARTIPPPLKEQLKVGGVMVIPVGEEAWVQSLYVVEKKSERDFKIKDVMPVAFVPLTGRH